MPKFQTEHEGKTIEVDIPDETVVKWGYISKADVQSKYVPKGNSEAQLKSALDSQREKLRQEFAEDDEFVHGILEAQGLPLDENGKVKLPEGGITSEELQERLKESRTTWEAQYQQKHVDPLSKKLSEQEKANLRMRDQIINSHIIQTAKDAGVKSDAFETMPGAPRESAPIIAQNRHRFAWNEEINGPALVQSRDNEGNPQFEINPEADSDSPYADGSYLWAKYKADKNIAPRLFEDKRITTDRLGNTNGRSSGKTWTRADWDRASATERMDFSKAGGQLED